VKRAGEGGDSQEYTVKPGHEKSNVQQLHCKSGRRKKWGRRKGLICNKYEHGSCLMRFLHRRTPDQSGKLALVVEAGG
jgi:hypothetical protein